MAIELIRQVTADSDDCVRRLTTAYFSLSGEYISAGWNGAANKQWGGGMRFLNITVPKGSTIIEAHLTLVAYSDKAGTVVDTRISAEDIDDAVTFANDGDIFDTRWANRTTARVDWDALPAWTDGVEYDSPDIKAVIQEIIDRPGWASGQDIVIFWEDFEDRSGVESFSYRDCDAHEKSAANAPKLEINYTEPLPEAAGGGPAALVAAGII